MQTTSNLLINTLNYRKSVGSKEEKQACEHYLKLIQQNPFKPSKTKSNAKAR